MFAVPYHERYGSMAQRRINKEWLDNERDPKPGITLTRNPDTPTIWNAALAGPAGTPYEGGVFHGQVRFPQDYPFKPFKFALTTKTYSTYAHGA